MYYFVIIYTADDFSTSPWYWNRFTISIASPEGLTAGIIDVPAGQYMDKIYVYLDVPL